jgi:hypothetical protein
MMDGTLTAFMERVRDFLDNVGTHVPPVEVDEDLLEVMPDDSDPPR